MKNTVVSQCWKGCGIAVTHIKYIIIKITSYCTQRKQTSICGRGRLFCGLQTLTSQDSLWPRQVGRHVSYGRTNHMTIKQQTQKGRCEKQKETFKCDVSALHLNHPSFLSGFPLGVWDVFTSVYFSQTNLEQYCIVLLSYHIQKTGNMKQYCNSE